MAVFGGIVEKSSNDGDNGSWQQDGVQKIRAVCVGAGGSGYRDNDDDLKGGGGGGGGRAQGLVTISPIGDTIKYKQAGESPQICDGKGGNNGDDSYVTTNGGSNIAYAQGGGTGTDDDGGGGGGSGNGNEDNKGGKDGADDDDGQDGGGAAGCDGCGNQDGGKGISINWVNSGTNAGTHDFGCNSCPSGDAGGEYGGGGAGSDNGCGGRGGKGYAGWAYFYASPSIDKVTVTNQFNTTPGYQGSGKSFSQKTPSDKIKIEWETTNVTRVDVYEGDNTSGTVVCNNKGANDSCNINTGLQSVRGTNSPAEKNYTIKATGFGAQTKTKTVTAKVKNDYTPDNSGLTKTHTGLDPETTYTGGSAIEIGSVAKVDMPVWAYLIDDVTESTSGLQIVKPAGGQSNPVKLERGNTIKIVATTPYFEVDITGRTDKDTGLINQRKLHMILGNSSFTITLKVKRPVIEEQFDFGGISNAYPNPDIDLLDNDSDIKEWMTTSTNTVNEIELSRTKIETLLGSGEISTEIKVDDPNVQVRINGDGKGWRNAREI